MKPIDLLDLEIYPPFDGFPIEGIQFLRKLKRNNNREWFGKHKGEFQEFVKLPIQSLVAALQPEVAKFAPEIDLNPRRSLFRIYRDTRFSKNKLPYKTHVAAVFHLKGRHWEESASYYVHIEPGEIYVGGGIYMPDGRQLKLVRQAIVADSKEFLSIVRSKSFVRRFKTLQGEKLSRTPLGFKGDEIMSEWLKFKQFYTGVVWDEKECRSPKFVKKVVEIYRELLPLIRFLNKSLKATPLVR